MTTPHWLFTVVIRAGTEEPLPIGSNRRPTQQHTHTTMKAPIIDLNSKHIKSYATRENLLKAMHEAGADEVRHLIVKNDRDRWICIVVGFEQNLLGKFPMVG